MSGSEVSGDGLGALDPPDEYNRILVDNVHPPDWINPEPAGRYNLVVLGAGSAGLVVAAIAAALGARVALIERNLMGGDCLNFGCVPSKGVIRAARVWAGISRASEFGVRIPGGAGHEFGVVMARMRNLRARISHADSAKRYKGMGVDVFIGDGRFCGPGAIEVAGKTLRFAKAAICTGARAALPAIAGLTEAGYLTNETLFSLNERPNRIAVIGAGPFGSEMAQAFARLGSRVSLFEERDHILFREDADAAGIVEKRMKRDGVCMLMSSRIIEIEGRGMDKVIRYESNGIEQELIVDRILIGVGRTPNVEGLGLEVAGVLYDLKEGVKVNRRLQTTNRHIFAAGDVCFPLKFTHAAESLARIVIQNALFPHPLGLAYSNTDSLTIPWCTYTAPEIARVGMNEAEAKARGIDLEIFACSLENVDRAVLDGEEEGFARVYVLRGTDKILGATIVAAHAGDMINELTLAINTGIGLGRIAETIHPYPTQAEAIKKVANAWRKTTLTDRKKRVLRRWFSWARRLGF